MKTAPASVHEMVSRARVGFYESTGRKATVVILCLDFEGTGLTQIDGLRVSSPVCGVGL